MFFNCSFKFHFSDFFFSLDHNVPFKIHFSYIVQMSFLSQYHQNQIQNHNKSIFHRTDTHYRHMAVHSIQYIRILDTCAYYYLHFLFCYFILRITPFISSYNPHLISLIFYLNYCFFLNPIPII